MFVRSVEDNETDFIVTRHQLSNQAPDLMRAETLQEAIDKLSNHKFDVVLLDLHLPDSDGLMVLSEILGPNLPEPGSV